MSERTLLDDEMIHWLKSVRDGGEINMLAAAPYLEQEFDMSKQDARAALIEWFNHE